MINIGMEEKIVYVLTETDTTDPKWCYNEVFGRREDAVRRMKQMYREDTIDREGILWLETELDEKMGTAYGRTADEIIISWNIKECFVFE